MQAEVVGLIEKRGRIVGLRGNSPAPAEVRADLAVAAGREWNLSRMPAPPGRLRSKLRRVVQQDRTQTIAGKRR